MVPLTALCNISSVWKHFIFWSPGCQQPYGATNTSINSSNDKRKDLQLVIGAIVKMEDTGTTDISH